MDNRDFILSYLKKHKEIKGSSEDSIYGLLTRKTLIERDEVKIIVKSLINEGLIYLTSTFKISPVTKSTYVIYTLSSIKINTITVTIKKVDKRYNKKGKFRRDALKRKPVKTKSISVNEKQNICPFLITPKCRINKTFSPDERHRNDYCLNSWVKYELCKYYQKEMLLRGALIENKRRMSYYRSMGFNVKE